jgi:hypothetical protein
MISGVGVEGLMLSTVFRCWVYLPVAVAGFYRGFTLWI